MNSVIICFAHFIDQNTESWDLIKWLEWSQTLGKRIEDNVGADLHFMLGYPMLKINPKTLSLVEGKWFKNHRKQFTNLTGSNLHIS